jgi:hypothetical protein
MKTKGALNRAQNINLKLCLQRHHRYLLTTTTTTTTSTITTTTSSSLASVIEANTSLFTLKYH